MGYRLLKALLSSLIWVTGLSSAVQAADLSRQVLAFYYGWYGNPAVSGQWRHWQSVDAGPKHIDNSTDFPKYGAYDSHDPETVERQAKAAHAVGITGFIASWWGRDSFEDRGMPLLLAAAAKHELAVTAYYEKFRARMPRAASNPRLTTSTIC